MLRRRFIQATKRGAYCAEIIAGLKLVTQLNIQLRRRFIQATKRGAYCVGIIAGLKNDIVRVVPQSTRNSFGAGKGRADATTVIYARVADKTESLKEPEIRSKERCSNSEPNTKARGLKPRESVP
jgi:hypothetical protein